MSKIGNYVVGLQESDDYEFGWNSAERGEPQPEWLPDSIAASERLVAQRMGWDDYRTAQVSP